MEDSTTRRRESAALARGIDYLVARQAEDGSWTNGYMYAQAIATADEEGFAVPDATIAEAR